MADTISNEIRPKGWAGQALDKLRNTLNGHSEQPTKPVNTESPVIQEFEEQGKAYWKQVKGED